MPVPVWALIRPGLAHPAAANPAGVIDPGYSYQMSAWLDLELSARLLIRLMYVSVQLPITR